MRQKITIVIDTSAASAEFLDERGFYKLAEGKGNGDEYEALKHFFEDIDIPVESITVEALS